MHTDALKMAGGLGSSKAEKGKDAGEEMDCQDDDDGKKEKKKKVRVVFNIISFALYEYDCICAVAERIIHAHCIGIDVY